MKKIYLLLAITAGFFITSCDMDKAPKGSLDDENAIENAYDLMKARNGVYEGMRSFATGAYLYLSDLQMDQFNGLTINGNRNGSLANGVILSGNNDIEAVWAACYSNIADANYVLKEAEKLIEKGELDTEDMLEVNRYIAETKFARAWYYSYLFDHWCEAYTPANANAAAKGLPLVTVFNPTGDIASYPGRSTMAETFELIDSDLREAYTGLKAYEEATSYTYAPMSAYVNSYTVLALQARLALWRQDWTTAVSKAQEIIDSKVYSLANALVYSRMWTQDNSNELIFRPVSSSTELGISSTGGAYISSNIQQADYVPTFETLLAYDENDVRFDSFFGTRSLSANGILYGAYVFNKYPGNSSLNTGTTNSLLNMGKPFRLSETYLILAEAAYEAGDAATANNALNTIRKSRIPGYAEATYSGEVLRQEIRAERTKELIGEGFRMSDLRRWGQGFQRDGSYPANPALEEIFVVAGLQVQYIANDHRYVWPIPTTEMENNPQLKGQQNPGY